MKALKTVKKVKSTLSETCSKMFDNVFDKLFGTSENTRIRNMHCTSGYFMTPGGAIIKK